MSLPKISGLTDVNSVSPRPVLHETSDPFLVHELAKQLGKISRDLSIVVENSARTEVKIS